MNQQRKYTHLSPFERGQIVLLHSQGVSIPEIAAQLQRDPRTIGRELARNSRNGRYDAEVAETLAFERQSRRSSQRYGCTPTIINEIMRRTGKALCLHPIGQFTRRSNPDDYLKAGASCRGVNHRRLTSRSKRLDAFRLQVHAHLINGNDRHPCFEAFFFILGSSSDSQRSRCC